MALDHPAVRGRSKRPRTAVSGHRDDATARPGDSARVPDAGPVAPGRPARRRGGPIDPRLIRRAKATQTYLIAGVAIGTLTAGLIICQAQLLSTAISSIFASHQLAGLTTWLILLACVLVGRGILSWAGAWVAQRTAAAVKSQLRRDIMAARLRSPENQASTSSSLVTLVTQGLDSLDGFFSKYLPQLLLAVTVPAITGLAILLADWKSALIIAATIPFIPALMALIGWHTEAQVSRRWGFQARLASHFADLVAGLPTLQVFGRAQAQARGLKRTEQANRGATMGILRVSFLSAFVLELFSTIAVAVVALVIGTRLDNGGMTLQSGLFALILAPEVYLAIRQVGVHYHDSADGMAAAEAAFAEIDRGAAEPLGGRGSAAQGSDQADGPKGPPLYPPAVELRGLTYTYPGADQPIGPFDLTLAPGESVALAGRSGGGKTTLLNVVLGFLVPEDTGAVGLGGCDWSDVDFQRWRAGIAYVPQVPGMIGGTIADNVRLGHPAASDDQVRAMLDAAGAANLAPDRTVGEEGEGLSVGERRRVGIARALARIELGGAKLLLLDEPTAGLDADTEAQVLLGVRQSGATALVVSHRAAVLAAVDRVVEIATAPGDAGLGAADSAVAAAVVAEPAGRIPDTTGSAMGGGSDRTQADTSQADAHQIPTSQTQINQAEADPTGPGEADPGEADPAAADPPLPRRGSPLMRLITALLDAMPHSRGQLVAAIVLAAAASGAAVSLMGVSGWLISKSAQQPPFLELTVAAVGVRFFGISRGVFRYVERLVGHDLALRMQSSLRLRTYRALSRTTLLGRRQGDLLVRVVSDVAAIEDVVVRIIQPFAAASLVVVGACVLLGRFSLPVALVVLASAILGGVIVPWLTARVSYRADQAAVPLRGELGTVVHDVARTATDLAAYGAEPRALARVGAVDRRLRQVEERAAWAGGIGAGLQVIAAGLGVLGGLWLGAVGVANGSIGDRLLAVMVLTPLALHEVFANFAQAAQTMTRARVALGRVVDILQAPAVGRGDVPVRPGDEAPSIDCRALAIGWPGQAPVAVGLDLTVRPGEAVGVMGPSGIGKTTLAATIMGLIPPLGGELTTTGRIGYLAQDAHIFATTVAENVRIGNRDASDAVVAAALAEAGLPIDPARPIGEMGSTLSGGEARRLALARLFAGDYRLLILDEPTEHLDRETADALLDDVFATVADRPLLIIAHDEAVAARCDRVLTLGG